jgi:TPR repeat protein
LSGNIEKCPFCNSNRAGKTDEEDIEELMKRAEANDAASIFFLANHYYFGVKGLQQDHVRAIELFTRAADLGDTKAHCHLGMLYHQGGNLKKAKFHFEAAAMAGHEGARNTLGCMEVKSRNSERAVKHWTIAASAGSFRAMHNLLMALEDRGVSRESIRLNFGSFQ